jgi:hypothetical protein
MIIAAEAGDGFRIPTESNTGSDSVEHNAAVADVKALLPPASPVLFLSDD